MSLGMRFEIEGDKELIVELKRAGSELGRAVTKDLQLSALKIQGDAQEAIQRGSRSGRVYKRRSVTHRASAPGEFPKTDTGDLVSNIIVKNRGKGAEVGSSAGAPHGLFLEYGTSKMEPRPWLLPTFNANLRSIERRLNATVNRVFR